MGIILVASLIIGGVVASAYFGINAFNNHNNSNEHPNQTLPPLNDVQRYLDSMGNLTDAVKAEFAPVIQSGTLDYVKDAIKEINDLGNYSNSPMVREVIREVAKDGIIDYKDLWRIQDIDGDYVKNFGDPNPVNPDTMGLGFGDLNSLFVYKLKDLTNKTEGEELLKNIPNVNVSSLIPLAGNTYHSYQKALDISSMDPVVKYYSAKIGFNWTDNSKTYGTFLVDGELSHLGYDHSSTPGIIIPAYYLTHERLSQHCGTSATTNTALLRAAGYDAHFVDCTIHTVTEVTIEGKDYVIDYNRIWPKDEYFKQASDLHPERIL
ncbi:MAG: hypothetical protein NWF05_05385 [Candidatus Bathyarchaeota archaeon]|nr:hypothetical protein [Candidatus Bathyarchaeota archaeon]